MDTTIQITNPSFDDEEPITAGRRPRVLVVDDDDDMRALVASALSSDGYRVTEARDGSDALDMMRITGRVPDAIVTDVCMGDVSGLSLLAALRDEGCMTPIIVMTAFGDEQVRGEALRLGADAIFDKPIDIEDLRIVVMNVLRPNDGPRAFANTLTDE